MEPARLVCVCGLGHLVAYDRGRLSPTGHQQYRYNMYDISLATTDRQWPVVMAVVLPEVRLRSNHRLRHQRHHQQNHHHHHHNRYCLRENMVLFISVCLVLV